MSENRPDALDLLDDEGAKLRELFERWDAAQAGSQENAAAAQADPDANAALVRSNYELGTLGKLLLEHGAVYLAACEEVSRRLRPDVSLKRELDAVSEATRPILDQLDEMNRGVAAVSVASPAFEAAIALLRSALFAKGSPLGDAGLISSLGASLGTRRSTLHSAKFVTRRAPTHPGTRRWYSQIPLVARVHYLYDWTRGCPWAESPNWADRALAEQYKPER